MTRQVDSKPFPHTTMVSDNLRYCPLEHLRVPLFFFFVCRWEYVELGSYGYVVVGVGSGAWANRVNVVERCELICTSLTDVLTFKDEAVVIL